MRRRFYVFGFIIYSFVNVYILLGLMTYYFGKNSRLFYYLDRTDRLTPPFITGVLGPFESDEFGLVLS